MEGLKIKISPQKQNSNEIQETENSEKQQEGNEEKETQIQTSCLYKKPKISLKDIQTQTTPKNTIEEKKESPGNSDIKKSEAITQNEGNSLMQENKEKEIRSETYLKETKETIGGQFTPKDLETYIQEKESIQEIFPSYIPMGKHRTEEKQATKNPTKKNNSILLTFTTIGILAITVGATFFLHENHLFKGNVIEYQQKKETMPQNETIHREEIQEKENTKHSNNEEKNVVNTKTKEPEKQDNQKQETSVETTIETEKNIQIKQDHQEQKEHNASEIIITPEIEKAFLKKFGE